MSKKEHTKLIEKTVKKLKASILQSLDKKQVTSAIKALKEYSSKVKKESMKKSLLDSEDTYVHLNFTMN